MLTDDEKAVCSLWCKALENNAVGLKQKRLRRKCQEAEAKRSWPPAS